MRLLPTNTYRRWSFEGVRLHLDDLERIAAHIEAAGLTVRWADAEFEYTGPAEVLEKRGERPRLLEISGTRDTDGASIDVEISGQHALLKTDSAKDLSALCGEITRTLSARDNKVLQVMHPAAFFVLAGVTWFLAASGWQITLRNGRDVSQLIPAIFVGLAIVASASRAVFGGLVLRRRHVGGFVRRNADKIGLLVIGAVLGAIISELSTLWRNGR